MTAQTQSILNDFNAFIRNHLCDKDDKEQLTHTTLIKGKGSRYSFKGPDYEEFMRKYVDVIKSNPDISLHFVERPSYHGVTFLFLDIDYDHKGGKRLYNEKHIKDIIEKTNDFIKDHFNVTDYQLTTYITEKPSPTPRDKNNAFKDGFHIYYPYLPMEEKHRFFVLDHLISLTVDKEILDDLKYTSDPKNIFDTSIIKSNGILMIGSRKEGGKPYELTHIYDSNCNDIPLVNNNDEDDEYDDNNSIEDLIYTLSNQRYDEHASIEPYEESKELIDDTYEQYGNGKNKTKNTKKTKKTEKIEKKHNDKSEEDDKHNQKKKSVIELRDIELAKELCKLFSKKRASEYTSWSRVGFALKAIDESLFQTFVDFSKKDMAKYNEGKVTCEDIWKVGNGYDYTIGSLRHWAMMDNKKGYYSVISKLNDEIFGKAETGKHVDIAEVIYELYKDRFACVDITKKKWYEFQSNKWVLVQSAHTLENLISGEVRAMLTAFFTDKLVASTDTDNGFERDTDFKRISKAVNNLNSFCDVKFRENIVRACANKFYDSKFMQKLDANPYLIGFENGVYDLKEDCFREGLPSDYVSKSVGYIWKEFDKNDPIFDEIMGFFKQIQVDDDMREYLLTFIASILRGEQDQKFHIWTGGGSNGKSATITLIEKLLGEYFGTVPITLLTRARGKASNATPELADKFGKRFLVMSETEHNDVLFVGAMKEYTGSNKIMARGLYGDPFEYVPMFKMAIQCNEKPTIPSTDNGTWRRIRETPFESEFIEGTPDPKKPRQFKMNKLLNERFDKWVQALMWMLIKIYYPKCVACKFAIPEPAKVLECTKAYKKNSDIYLEFIEENLLKTGSDKDTEQITNIFDLFKGWYNTSYSEKAPPRKTFVTNLKKTGLKLDSQNIYGVKYAFDPLH